MSNLLELADGRRQETDRDASGDWIRQIRQKWADMPHDEMIAAMKKSCQKGSQRIEQLRSERQKSLQLKNKNFAAML
ncbi:hypothetical protein AGMMS49959_14780 [Planctomycetales bacterium]|nr:hypothetical protein AGMMS49959_14780 [Planctomycetales bacterium]